MDGPPPAGIGTVYPPDAKTPEGRLRFYARHFPFVEVDSTHYSLEMEEQASSWAAWTPDQFVFDVKAYRSSQVTRRRRRCCQARCALGPLPQGKGNWYYTQLPPDARQEAWRYFEPSMAPLRAPGKVGAIILQFPHWVGPTDESARDLNNNYYAQMNPLELMEMVGWRP